MFACSVAAAIFTIELNQCYRVNWTENCCFCCSLRESFLVYQSHQTVVVAPRCIGGIIVTSRLTLRM